MRINIDIMWTLIFVVNLYFVSCLVFRVRFLTHSLLKMVNASILMIWFGLVWFEVSGNTNVQTEKTHYRSVRKFRLWGK